MQTSQTKRSRFPAWIACASFILILQGCSHTPVYRGIPSSEAAAIVTKLVGTGKPVRTTLANYYQAKESQVSWRGTWNCNSQLTIVTMINLVLTAGEGNSFEGTRSVVGDSRCTSLDTDRIAGRYDDNYLYLYYPSMPTTFINKYEINKKVRWADETQIVEGALVFLGQLKYIDNVWRFQKARDNPQFGVTGRKIPESGGWADMWSSTELVPQTQDPRLTAEQRRRATLAEEGRKAGEIAGRIAAREAEDAADERASNRAANAAAFNAVAQNLAAESARRRAEAAQPRSNLLADSQRAADAARAETERRAEAARQRNAGTTQASRLTGPTSTYGNVSSASRTAPAPSKPTPSAPSRPSVSMPPTMSVATTEPTPGRQPESAPAHTYTCLSSTWFRSPIRYHDLVKEVRTSTFEEACARVEQQVAQFVASIAKGTSSAYGSGSVVKSVDACRKTRNEDDAVVYVHLDEPSSRPCGTPSNGIAR